MPGTRKSSPGLDELSRRFMAFAADCSGYSPLYERLGLGVAREPALLGLVTHARPGQRRPTLFFAAVNYLLLSGDDHRLAAYYPSVCAQRGVPAATGDPWVHFRDFCLSRRDRLLEVIAGRRTQTNEVGRCSMLLPALQSVWREHQLPLALVEVGCSAGLNLLFDRWSYRYSDGSRYGADGSPVRIDCEVRGRQSPPVDPEGPVIAARLGVDVAPPDVAREDSRTWLRACVYADQTGRARRLTSAIELLRRDPPDVRTGNAVDLVASLVSAAPPGTMPVVFHTWVLTYLTRGERRRFTGALEAVGSVRPFAWVAGEAAGTVPGQPPPAPGFSGPDSTSWFLASVGRGVRWTMLGSGHHHGAWAMWARRAPDARRSGGAA